VSGAGALVAGGGFISSGWVKGLVPRIKSRPKKNLLPL